MNNTFCATSCRVILSAGVMSHRIPHYQRPHLHTQSEAKSSFDDVSPTPSTASIPVTHSKLQNHKGCAMQKHEDRAVQCQRTTASTQASFSQKQFYSSCPSQSRISQDHSCRVHRDAFKEVQKGKYHSVWLKVTITASFQVFPLIPCINVCNSNGERLGPRLDENYIFLFCFTGLVIAEKCKVDVYNIESKTCKHCSQ